MNLLGRENFFALEMDKWGLQWLWTIVSSLLCAEKMVVFDHSMIAADYKICWCGWRGGSGSCRSRVNKYRRFLKEYDDDCVRSCRQSSLA